MFTELIFHKIMSALYPGERRRLNSYEEFELVTVEEYEIGNEWTIRSAHGQLILNPIVEQLIVQFSCHVDNPHYVQIGERRHWKNHPDSTFEVVNRSDTPIEGVMCAVILGGDTDVRFWYPELHILNQSVLIEEELNQDVDIDSSSSDSDSSQFELFD